MSGTSFDGVDAALITTNGKTITSLGPSFSLTYPELFRQNIRKIISGHFDHKLLLEVEDEITIYHARAVNELLKKAKLEKEQVNLIGFHGQSVFHDSRACKTWQLANPSLLAELTGINVIADFRRRDMACGGEGAPLVPLFHQALFSKLAKPLAVVNIGGVANITYLAQDGSIIAFDTGPGCALIDDWVNSRTQKRFDENGAIAASGSMHTKRLDKLINNNYFHRKPPKSLDRNQFANMLHIVSPLSTADGAAVLTHFTAKTLALAANFLPQSPKNWIISGGGRYNSHLMQILRDDYGLPIKNIDELSFQKQKLNGCSIEAWAFGFLAVRAFYGLPLSQPTTTGTVKPVSGGALYLA